MVLSELDATWPYHTLENKMSHDHRTLFPKSVWLPVGMRAAETPATPRGTTRWQASKTKRIDLPSATILSLTPNPPPHLPASDLHIHSKVWVYLAHLGWCRPYERVGVRNKKQWIVYTAQHYYLQHSRWFRLSFTLLHCITFPLFFESINNKHCLHHGRVFCFFYKSQPTIPKCKK